MDSEGDYYSSPGPVVHDMFHQLGLGDRYGEDATIVPRTVTASVEYQHDLLGLEHVGKFNSAISKFC
jgi:hypothetical protein